MEWDQQCFMPHGGAEARGEHTSILGRMATYSGKMIRWEEALGSQLTLAPKRYAFDAAPPTPAVAVPGFTEVL